MDGFETRDRLHGMGVRIPVVFITADSNMDSPDWIARTRGSPCLRKPFEEEELVQTIEALLGGAPR
jgi:CheY-like chemotaxis protein